nr:putative ribonuclease h protein [Quercus suber]
MVDARVEILIDEETHGWNHSVIDGIFIPEEAELIKSMPLPQQGVDDRLFWPFTQTGTYTSKSVYRYLKSEEEDSSSAVRSEEDRDLWRGIWSLKVPNKVKNFIWRASRNSLPTKENLVRRTVIENPLCDRCFGAHESALHAVWSCGELDVVWEDITLWSCRGSITFFTFKELLSWLIKNQHHVELFSVTARTIWNQWNQVRLNKPSCSSHQISQLTKERLQEFMAVNALPHSSRTGPPTVQKWKPPEHGLVKVNCDGARFTKENSAGVGVVIRNSEGLVLGSLLKLVPQAYSPLEIEAMAIATTLEFASALGCQRAIIETDSLVLVKALREDTEFLSAVGLVLDEIRRKVNFFNELHYSHVKREGNIVAHKLARHAISVSDVVVWMEDVPPLLFPVVLADIAGFS